MSDNKQKPFSNYNLKNKKNPVPRTQAMLNGYIANSMNGGHNRTIAYKQVFAGERHKEYKLRMNIKMLTPLTPTYQALKCTLRAYFVPNSRVWDNAEAFQAQNPTNENTPHEYPNLNSMPIPWLAGQKDGTGDYYSIPITQSEQWRDMFMSSYVPRLLADGEPTLSNYNSSSSWITFPRMNVLPLRGRVAIYNDYERNKEYETAVPEYKTDTVTYDEMINYLPVAFGTASSNDVVYIDRDKWFNTDETTSNKKTLSPYNLDYYQMRAKRDDSYYTDYRTQVGGNFADNDYAGSVNGMSPFNYQATDAYLNTVSDENGVSQIASPVLANNAPNMAWFTWAEWENYISEARSQSENANLTDWQIIAKLRGSKLLTEGKVQLIGQRTFNLNNKAVTQTSNNSNENVEPMYRSMGTQGAYSYTEIEVPVYSGMEFNEDGFVHIIATVSADTVFESGIDATLLNVSWDEQYRPELKNQKTGVLRYLEMGTDLSWAANIFNSAAVPGGSTMDDTQLQKIVGYKRKYNEYFKLPNIIAGDMTSNPWRNAQTIDTETGKTNSTFGSSILNTAKTLTNKTFQYFEESADGRTMQFKLPVSVTQMYEYLPSNEPTWAGKKIWKDYTDLEINANQAVQNPIVLPQSANGGASLETYVAGQNQIFFVGKAYCDAILPINWEIKENATEWGEH